MKNSNRSKHVCSGYGTAFHGWGSWNFGNDFARNVTIFYIDDNSSSHTDNCKNNFFVLGEGPLMILMAVLVQ